MHDVRELASGAISFGLLGSIYSINCGLSIPP